MIIISLHSFQKKIKIVHPFMIFLSHLINLSGRYSKYISKDVITVIKNQEIWVERFHRIHSCAITFYFKLMSMFLGIKCLPLDHVEKRRKINLTRMKNWLKRNDATWGWLITCSLLPPLFNQEAKRLKGLKPYWKLFSEKARTCQIILVRGKI